MTARINPAVSVAMLSRIQPGSIVLIDGQFGFVTVSDGDAGPSRSTAMYVVDTRFEHRPRDDIEVLSFGNDLIIEPEIASFVENVRPDTDSGPELFLLGGEPFVVLHIANGGIRFLSLSTGKIKQLQPVPSLHAFRNWTISLTADRVALMSVT